MADRCHACGGWLRADDTHCPTCQEPVPGKAEEADPLALDDADLDLDVGHGARPSSAAAASGPWGGYGGGAGDPFDDPLAANDDGPDLDVDESATQRPSGGYAVAASGAAAAQRAVSSSPPAEPVASGAPASRTSGPPAANAAARSSAPPARDFVEPGPVEVVQAAGYPEPPAGLLGSLPYVVYVAQRRQELAAEQRRAAGQREVAERHAELALLELGQTLFDRADELRQGELAPHLQDARQLARHVQQSGQQRQQTEQEAEARRRELDAQIDAAEQDANPLRDRETRLRTQLEAREHDLKRAQAQLQRTSIELRNVRSSQAPDASRRQMLEADEQAKRADAEIARGKVGELSEQLADVRRELAGKLGHIASLREQRRQTDATLESQVAATDSQADAATQRYRAALRDLGEQAVRLDLASHGGDAGQKAVNALSARAASRREERLYQLARDAFEKKPLVRGLALLGGAAFVILVMIVTAIVL